MPDDFKLPEEWRDAVLDAIRNSRAVGTEDEVDVALSALTPHVRELVEALERLRLSAAMLHQNSAICAANHHRHEHQDIEEPGWLADARKDIEAAAALLSKFRSGGGSHG